MLKRTRQKAERVRRDSRACAGQVLAERYVISSATYSLSVRTGLFYVILECEGMLYTAKLVVE